MVGGHLPLAFSLHPLVVRSVHLTTQLGQLLLQGYDLLGLGSGPRLDGLLEVVGELEGFLADDGGALSVTAPVTPQLVHLTQVAPLHEGEFEHEVSAKLHAGRHLQPVELFEQKVLLVLVSPVA